MDTKSLIARVNQLTVALFISITSEAVLRVENDRLKARLAALEAVSVEYVGRCKWSV